MKETTSQKLSLETELYCLKLEKENMLEHIEMLENKLKEVQKLASKLFNI